MKVKFKVLLLLFLLVGCSGFSKDNSKNTSKYEDYIKKVSDKSFYGDPKKIDFVVDVDVDRSLKLPKNDFAVNVGEAIELGDVYVKNILSGGYDSFLRRIYMYKSYEKINLNSKDLKISNAKFEKEYKVLGNFNFVDGKIDKIENVDFKQNDRLKVEKIISILNKILPMNYLRKITEIEVIDDVKIESPMYVLYSNNNDGMKLGINLPILENEYYQNDKFLSDTIIHEFAHIFSMDKSQLVSGDVIYKSDYIWELLVGYKDDSYLKKFYNTFWKDVPEDWTTTKYKSQKEMVDFYLLNDEVFSNGYASTNVHEDFAESFKYFITEKIDFNSNYVLEKKVKFFYQFPELVLLRLQILKNLMEK